MTEARGKFGHGYCQKCGAHGYRQPLHGERGGPLFCLLCLGKFDAEHMPQRRARRRAISALRAYSEAGGSLSGKELDDLALAASGMFEGGAGELVDFADLTSELLTAALALTHPDKHPAERRAEAQRVTQQLLALKPFIFPAPAPKPTPAPDVSAKPSQPERPELERAVNELRQYPCDDCRNTISDYYCDVCKSRWNEERQQKRTRDEQKRQDRNRRQRECYGIRRQWRAETATCDCGNVFKPTRSDRRYCSAACRQRAYVKRAGKPSNARPLSRAEIERTVSDVLTSNPAGAFTVVDLCAHVYPGLKRSSSRWVSPAGATRLERKHRDAVVAAGKTVCERLGHWDWLRGSDFFSLPGAPLVFFNCADVRSYGLARLKSDPIDGYKSEAELKATLAPGGENHEYVVEGGAWWQHTQEWLTDRQIATGADLTSRHEAAGARSNGAAP